MTARVAVHHAPPFHAPGRCRVFPLQFQETCSRSASDFSHLREKMTSRRLPYIKDYISPMPTKYLRLSLADFLPDSGHRRSTSRLLSPTHHLVYFPNVTPSSLLLPDGTDSLHSPGPPFTRRMWAGGSVTINQDIQVDSRPFHCAESITDVQVKGSEGEEKIYIGIERVIYAGHYPGDLTGSWHMSEQRTLVFMRDNRQEGSPAVSQPSHKFLRPTLIPDFSHIMIPTRELLFRFSALTFNSHAIHLDKQFCREVEGHRNLLVHGPLTLVLMIECLRVHLKGLASPGSDSSSVRRPVAKIKHVEYRNLAPLYAEEEMKICAKSRVKNTERKTFEGYDVYDVWIEGPDGGYAVKGNVTTFAEFEMLDHQSTSSFSWKAV